MFRLSLLKIITLLSQAKKSGFLQYCDQWVEMYYSTGLKFLLKKTADMTVLLQYDNAFEQMFRVKLSKTRPSEHTSVIQL